MGIAKALSYTSASAVFLMMGLGGFAQAQIDTSENVEVLVSANCACYHPGARVPYLGEVMGDAVMVLSRSEYQQKSDKELRESVPGETWLAINDSARMGCGHKSRWAQNGIGNTISVGFGMHPRVSCSSDLRFSRPR